MGRKPKDAPVAEPAAPVPASPSSEQVKEARLKAGLSTEKAGALLYRTARNWQQWEAGERQMDAALWELFRIKTMMLG